MNKVLRAFCLATLTCFYVGTAFGQPNNLTSAECRRIEAAGMSEGRKWTKCEFTIREKLWDMLSTRLDGLWNEWQPSTHNEFVDRLCGYVKKIKTRFMNEWRSSEVRRELESVIEEKIRTRIAVNSPHDSAALYERACISIPLIDRWYDSLDLRTKSLMSLAKAGIFENERRSIRRLAKDADIPPETARRLMARALKSYRTEVLEPIDALTGANSSTRAGLQSLPDSKGATEPVQAPPASKAELRLAAKEKLADAIRLADERLKSHASGASVDRLWADDLYANQRILEADLRRMTEPVRDFERLRLEVQKVERERAGFREVVRRGRGR